MFKLFLHLIRDPKLVLIFAVGIIFGFLSSSLLSNASSQIRQFYISRSLANRHDQPPDINTNFHEEDEEFHENDDSIAKDLYRQVRILCWVMTSPATHRSKARHVKATWGKRCNILLFMSSEFDESLPSVALPVGEGRNNLWAKTKEAFKFVWTHYKDQADWFYKADDDTYTVVENMRYMLAAHSPDSPVYFGCRFKPYARQGYMSGGAGYVLSRQALQEFVEEGLAKHVCRQDNDGAEDVEMGLCLEKVGVKAMDSRDIYGRGRFFPFVPEDHLVADRSDPGFWYWKFIYYNTTDGLDCCADSAISFHYVNPKRMYAMEYLIYHLIPYGIEHKFKKVELWNETKVIEAKT